MSVARGWSTPLLTRPPGLSRAVLALVLTGYTVVEIISSLAGPASLPDRVVSTLTVVVLLVLQLVFLSWPGEPWSYWVRCLVLVAQALVLYVPVAFVGPPEPGAPGFLAGSVLLVLPPVLGVPLFAGVVISTAVLDLLLGETGQGLLRSGLVAIVTAITGLVVYGFTTLVRLVEENHRTRAELSRMAAAQERLRLARDVHDLLGLSLSAITMKCELVWRLLGRHGGAAEQARAQLADVLVMARRAMADVRTVAHGRHDLSLDEECRLAEQTLSALGVKVGFVREGPSPVGPAGSTLAMVLREGVTNVLRHSEAARCEITLTSDGEVVRLGIVNDGVPAGGVPDPDGGSGLASLAKRVQTLGGELVVRGDGDTHELRVRVPAAG